MRQRPQGERRGRATDDGPRRKSRGPVILDLDENDLKNGVLGLVVALVEVVKETLEIQALKRMEGGSLTPEEVERLGEALLDLDAAIEKIKVDMGIEQSVKAVRDSLDRAVQDVVRSITAPLELEETGVSR